MFIRYSEIRELLRSKASDFFHKYSVPRWMLFIHDSGAVFVSFLFAYLLRFNLAPGDFPMNQAVIHGLIALFVYTVFMLIFRSYAGLIRHTTLTDVSLVFVSTTASALFLTLLSVGERHININQILIIPVSVILIHYVLITVFLFSMRISVKKSIDLWGRRNGFYCKEGSFE
jgi:FlaA1/EpsC-like NDP-sugar epimerase